MELWELLRAQAGVVTTTQAVACGVPARSVYRRVAAGHWWTPLPGVHHDRTHPYGPEARLRAVSFWAGPDAVLHGPTAAWWHGILDAAPVVAGVTVPRRTRRAVRPGVRVRRRDLHPADRGVRRGVGVTARPLTVLETAVALPDGAALLDRALQRGMMFGALHAAWCRMTGATGAPRARELLIAAGDRAGSGAERRLMRVLREAGLTGWVRAHRVGPYELDLAFPAERVGVEFDGWAWHSDVARFRNDRRKGNVLAGHGWTILRVTWHDLDTAPGRVVAEIRRALRLATG
ncbi:MULTISPECIES: type IV toxin-antitoxin system AbiEi family antitoxin domain-containing protein [Pseudonocardia]|jgi:very-short-patch-repair endonuclease|uniref:type IV toxin-antitoxin system AbiEi family antitoxin domain-containing protein n=2 Tax=Pseudonocardiaceae TaxID=2070 RepID=UPI00090FF7C1|nr:hypothetical protein BG618_01859 [Pseudonocardia autotrophica]